jgi:uncharacterized repeat protein (TIGR01451 family)
MAALVTVVGPPRPDFEIDGNGAGVFGLAGTGQGGTSTRGAAASSVYTSVLVLRNAGSYPDSFQVQWDVPTGWPAASVTIGDTLVAHSAPFWSPVLDPGESASYTVTVTVPASANGAHTAIINAWSSLPPNLAESVALVTETRALVRGTVFDDRDHDGVFGPGDIGLGGVLIVETQSGRSILTSGDGSYSLLVPPDSLVVVEQNPPGFASLSPDTVDAGFAAAGDTVVAEFADVGILTITAGGVTPGVPGGVVDFAHRVQARTAGHVDLVAVVDSSLSSAWYFDANGNGLLDGPDRPLAPADGDLDPDGPGGGVLHVILRAFVPAGATPGSTLTLAIAATQAVTLTPLVLTANATDAVLVTPAGSGQLAVQKSLDRTDAAPGDLITYAVRMFNAGTDSLANVTLIDPVSPWVDVEPGAFGAGLDARWDPPAGAPVFLTFDPSDTDECEYTSADRTLRVILSKNTVFYLAPGESCVVTYRVRVR